MAKDTVNTHFVYSGGHINWNYTDFTFLCFSYFGEGLRCSWRSLLRGSLPKSRGLVPRKFGVFKENPQTGNGSCQTGSWPNIAQCTLVNPCDTTGVVVNRYLLPFRSYKGTSSLTKNGNGSCQTGS